MAVGDQALARASGEEKALIAVSLLADGRVVAGHERGPDVLGMLAEAQHDEPLLRLLKRLAVAHRPPTGFPARHRGRAWGSHSGHFDIKRGGLLPIVDIARYAAMAGIRPRPRPSGCAPPAAGVLEADKARSLEEAFDLFAALRLEHQVDQLRAARAPDNHVDPKSLNALTAATSATRSER